MNIQRHIAWWIGYGLKFRALQNFVGLRKVRISFSAAVKVNPEVLRFFPAISLRLKEGYGMPNAPGFPSST